MLLPPSGAPFPGETVQVAFRDGSMFSTPSADHGPGRFSSIQTCVEELSGQKSCWTTVHWAFLSSSSSLMRAVKSSLLYQVFLTMKYFAWVQGLG